MKSVRLYVILILSVCVIFFSSDDSIANERAASFQAAMEASNNGRHEEAIAKFNEVLKDGYLENEPEARAHVLISRAMSYHRLKSFKSAIRDATEAIELTPNDAIPHYVRGVSFSRTEDWSRAINDYTAAIRLDSDLTSSYRYRAGGYYHQRSYAKAISDILVYLESHADDADAIKLLAASYMYSGEFELASSSFSDAIKIAPSMSAAYAGRGLSNLARGCFSNAFNDFVDAFNRGFLGEFLHHYFNGVSHNPVFKLLTPSNSAE